MIDIKDSFSLQDIRRNCPYGSLEHAKQDLKRCFLACDYTPEVFMFKDYNGINDCVTVSYTGEKNAKARLSKIFVGTKIVNNKVKDYSAWNLYIDNAEEFTVIALKFYSPNKDIFSYFRGYDYECLEEVDMNLIQPWLCHVHDVIANHNEEVYKYILTWIAKIIQIPDHKNDTALVILGKPGSGKNTFFTDVVCQLMSRYANPNVTSIESIVGRFNTAMENKKIVVLNELQSIDSNKYLNSDALKSIITDRKIVINQKMEPERLAENVANFIFVSNNDVPLKIEASDRRYLVTCTSDERCKDFKYFAQLADMFTGAFYENLFTFFMQYKCDMNLRIIPSTEAKDNIVEACTSSYELFVRDFYESINRIPVDKAYTWFNQYCETNGYQKCSKRTFAINMKKFTGPSKSVYIDGKSTRVYTLLPDVYRKFRALSLNDQKEAERDDHLTSIINDSI